MTHQPLLVRLLLLLLLATCGAPARGQAAPTLFLSESDFLATGLVESTENFDSSPTALSIPNPVIHDGITYFTHAGGWAVRGVFNPTTPPNGLLSNQTAADRLSFGPDSSTDAIGFYLGNHAGSSPGVVDISVFTTDGLEHPYQFEVSGSGFHGFVAPEGIREVRIKSVPNARGITSNYGFDNVSRGAIVVGLGEEAPECGPVGPGTTVLNGWASSGTLTSAGDSSDEDSSEWSPRGLPSAQHSASAAAGVISESFSDLSNEGFELVFDHYLIDTTGKAETHASIYFSVDEDTCYTALGSYLAIDSTGQAVNLRAQLTDVTLSLPPYFSADALFFFSDQVSSSTPDEDFVLGEAGGDSFNVMSGSLTGILIAGHDYELSFAASTRIAPVFTDPYPALEYLPGSLTATGFFSLRIGGGGSTSGGSAGGEAEIGSGDSEFGEPGTLVPEPSANLSIAACLLALSVLRARTSGAVL